eukprot:m.56473 g.56473  ORF g.56473 m.56473 type:complete len:63 (-) comp11040_c0_seq1:260-448(-)
MFPEFWIQKPIDGNPASVGNGTHVAFLFPTKAEVDKFFEVAVKNGAKGDGKPGGTYCSSCCC